MKIAPRLGPVGFFFSALTMTAIGLNPSSAHAELPGPGVAPVAVIGVDTDDADEQAEAVTTAFKARVRTVPGYSLFDTPQSLSTLTTGLKCTPKPDAACEVKIADQLKVANVLWGTMKKVKGTAKVELELRYIQRGKATQRFTESYSDNVKDARDPAIDRIVTRAMNRMMALQFGVAKLRAAQLDCPVSVDGKQVVQLDRGVATVELAPGSHTFELQAPCENKKTTAQVPANGEASIDLLHPVIPLTVEQPSKPIPWRLIAGLGTSAVGVGFGIYAITRWASYSSLQDDIGKFSPSVPAINGQRQDICVAGRAPGSAIQQAGRLCDQANNAGNIGIMSGGIGLALILTGVAIIVTDPGTAPSKTKAQGRSLHVDPMLGKTNGLSLSGAF